MRNFYQNVLNIIIVILLIVFTSFAGIPITAQAQSLTSKITPNQDIFVSSSTDRGNRRMLFIGKYTDYTAVGVPTYYNSRGLIRFELPSLTNILIESAELKVFHYGSNAAVNIQVARITNGWNEGSIYPGPGIEGNYGSATIPYFNTNYSNNIQARTIPLSLDLFSKLAAQNYGLALIPQNGSNVLGMVICSGNSDAFCLAQHRPKLILKYRLNSAPNTPTLINPVNATKFSGNCDESITPSKGTCRKPISVNFNLGNIADVDSYPGNLKHTIINFSGKNNNLSSPPIIGSGNITYSASQLKDGIINWQAYSVDNLGQKSPMSQIFSLTIDTTPPSVPLIKRITQPDNNSYLLFFIPSQDNLTAIQNLSYLLEYSPDSKFQSQVFNKRIIALADTLKLGISGFDGISGTKDDLNTKITFYFRVKAGDDQNNISAWSNIVSSIPNQITPTPKQNIPLPPKDKTPPETPEILWADFCNLKICLDLKGEANAAILVNETVLATMPTEGIIRNLIIQESWSYGELYQFIIKLKDQAGNESPAETIKLQAPILGDGNFAGSKDNTFADKNLETLPTAQVEIELDGQNKAILKKFNLPAPIVTYAEKDRVTSDINIWGIAVAKNYAFPATVNITKHSITYGEAAAICHSNIPAFFWDYQCLSAALGVDLNRFLSFEAASWWECSTQTPFFWQTYLVHECLKNKRITNSETLEQKIVLPHVELQAYRNKYINITSLRNCTKDSLCKADAQRYWNDNEKGEWNMHYSTKALVTGNNFFVKANVYGPLEISYHDLKISITTPDSGIESPTSNIIKIPEAPVLKFISPTQIYCGSAYLSGANDYGPRKLDGVHETFHDGVDIANNGQGCPINPILDGKVIRINDGYGKTVVIDHENGFKSIYGHNAEIYVKIPNQVVTTTKLSYMGQTGYAFGIHLHLRMDKDGAPKDPKGNRTVDPLLYFTLPEKK